jgi:hypothetical protein
VAQLGAGLVGVGQVSYPSVIDSHQTFVNGSSPGPDSASRIDAELIMDILKTLVAIETILGANPQGVFASLAARLNQVFPGGGGVPGVVTFTAATSVAIPGAAHNVGQAALLWQLYDAQIPAHAMDPGSVTMQVDPLTYDVYLTFVTPTSGFIALGATSPIYLASFTNTTSFSVPGTTHQLGTPDLLFQVYDNGSPRRTAMEPGALTVNATTNNVLLTFTTPQSGLLVLAAGSPGYATNITLTTPPYTTTITGATHQLGTKALFFQTYTTATPRVAVGDPQVTVNPTTFDITITFSASFTGRMVFGAAATLSGHEFDIRDAGVINSSAVRIRSLLGNLYLQAGLGEHIYLQDKLGASKVTVDTAATRVGIGTTAPAATLQLGTGSAIKPGGGPWDAPSDVRQKEGVRPFEDGKDLELLMQLEAVWFRYNGLGGTPRSEEEYVGFVAQALQTVAPYMVRSRPGQLTPDGPATALLSVNATALPYLLLNGVKTLHARLREEAGARAQLQATVATLETRLQRLEEATA